MVTARAARRSPLALRADGVHVARADGLRGALQLLHHPDDTGGRAQCSDLRRAGEVERVAAAGFKEIALTGVHLGSYGRDLHRVPRWCAAAGARRSPTRPHLQNQLARADGLHARDCRARGSQWWPVRAAFSPAAAARERSHARPDAPSVHAGRTIAGWSIRIAGALPHASIGTDMIVGFPWRDR